MLALRPNCEYCDKNLPPDSPDVRICSYECTFCAGCADEKLHDVCPNCGGGLAPRPIRPAKEWRKGLSRHNHPPSAERVHLKHDRAEIATFVQKIKDTPPEQR